MGDMIFKGEMQLLRWSETSNQGATIALQLAEPNELEPFKTLTMAKKGMAGQRLAVVIVVLDDDESTVPPPEPTQEKPKGGINSQWVAMRCNETMFWDFLRKEHGMVCATVDGAANAVRAICKVTSRAELDTDKAAEERFHSLIRLPYMKFMQGRQS